MAERVVQLALAGQENPARAVGTIRQYAREILDSGYAREALLEDFEHARSLLEAKNRDDAEDDVVSVMDALVGWCSTHLKL